ncbi:MAG: response regulator [Lachnospiraceae bacterium]|nr:response regulator [Lachnospiraceae bacterium]
MGKISELEMMDIACDELVDTLAATGIDLMQAMSSKLDTDAGLRYCADDKNFYIETIHSYMVDNKIKELEKQYQLTDWREYRMIVHTIKGTSKTIGALDLFQEAEKLEMAAKDLDEDYILANHDSFLEDYNILLEFIHDTFLAAQRINDGVNDDVLASQGEVLNSAQYVVDSLENLNNQIEGTSSATISGAEVLASMKASIGMANILVVDDTYMYLQLMKKILSGKHNVYLAESAEVALEMLDLIHVDLMLLDVHMPDVDGLELLRIIRNNTTQKAATISLTLILIRTIDSHWLF